MAEHVISRPSEATIGSPGHSRHGDERAEAALRQFVRLLARIAVAEALGAVVSGSEPPAPDLSV